MTSRNPKPSQTALKIARFLVLMDAMPRLRGVLPPGAAKAAETLLLESGASSRSRVALMRRPGTATFARAAERVFGQGQLLWFALRKRWMADRVEEAIAAGARQLLVLGSGFDPLALQVANRFPEVLSMEIDAPPTAEAKRRGVSAAGLARANHRIIAADLSQQTLSQALADTPWKTDVRSVVVAEGLLMYLRAEDVDALFQSLLQVTGAGSRVAFSTVGANSDGGPDVGWLDRPIRFALRLIGEPIQWGIEPHEVEGFLAQRGYRAAAQPSPLTLREQYLVPLGLAEEPLRPYERLVLAIDDRDEGDVRGEN